MKELLDALGRLHFMVRYGLDHSRNSGTSVNLEGLALRLKKIRTMAEDKRPRKIGIFGCPKRGKSTLLNVFLGGDFLPSGVTPTTHCSVILHNEGKGLNGYTLTIDSDDERILFRHEMKEAAEVNRNLRDLFSSDKDTYQIEVKGDFSQGITLPNSVLIDTPGAEAAFAEGYDLSGKDAREISLAKDTERALEILSIVDVPLFCMRVGQIKSNGEKTFYQKYLKQISPINIINFKDECNDEEDLEEVIELAEKEYGLNPDDTVAVSAKEGLSAVLQRDGKKLKDSGIEKLKDLIESRLRSMEPETAFKQAFSEYETILKRAKEKSLLPPFAYIEGLKHCLRDLPSMEAIRRSLEDSFWES